MTTDAHTTTTTEYAGFEKSTPSDDYLSFARSSRERMIAGICGAIAEKTGLDVALVRVLAVVAAFATSGAALLVYLAAWMLLPESTSD